MKILSRSVYNKIEKGEKMRQTKIVIRPCPICLNKSGEILHNQRFALPDKSVLPSAYDIVCCKRCGFVYADTSATQKEYDQYYQSFSKYEDSSIASGGGTTPWDAQRMDQTASDLTQYVLDKKAAMVDIGCANGGLLIALRKMGYVNLLGIDPSKVCVKHVNQQGVPARVGGLFSENLSDFKNSFDCVILCHVLEHVCDLRSAIENVIGLLKKGGILFVEVPDASRYLDYFIVPFHYFDHEHINHFDEHSLRNLIVQFGCESLASVKSTISVSKSNLYPTVYMAFRKQKGTKSDAIIKPDLNLCERVKKYIQRSKENSAIRTVYDYVKQAYLQFSRDTLDKYVLSQEGIVVWGVGSYSLGLLSNTVLNKCHIISFVDSDVKKQNTYIGNIPVKSPQILLKHNGPIVIASALYAEAILAQINEMQLENEVVII
ncbi:MAG: class I SAM-dependent methyltransferase [Candidatus Margulisbacteria bacterium]|nr:class I SAM-dependent methyltransferase [Candidatus Margulisiibacteriota bacterium]